MATQQEVIKTFMVALDNTNLKGSAAVDAAIRACSNFQSTQDAIDKMISDCNRAGSGDLFLRNYCGIILDNSDTGAITGSDAGGSQVKTDESIVPENGSLKNFTGNAFTVNGLKFKLAESFDSLSDKEKFIWRAMYTWWAKSALDLVETSYGLSFKDSDVYFKEITVQFQDISSSTFLAMSGPPFDINNDGKFDFVGLVVNMRYWEKFNYVLTGLDESNPNGKSANTNYYFNKTYYLDKTLAHELTHMIMFAKMLNSYDYPDFVQEGLSELTVGIDNERRESIQFLAQSPTTLQDNLNGTSTVFSYAAGYMFFRYLAKQASDSGEIVNNSSNTTVYGTSGKDTISNSGSTVKVYAYGGNDSIYNSANYVSLDGGTGNDTINNNALGDRVSIIGGVGNDSIHNYGDYVTITGGAGNDTVYNNCYPQSDGSIFYYTDSDGSNVLFKYASGDGNDKIYGFKANSTLSITGGSYSSVKSGSDVIVTVGEGKITLVGAASLSGGGSDNSTLKTVTNSTKSPVSIGSAIKNVDASTRTTAVKITGNALNNSIKGGSNKDTLSGGDGADTLSGGNGNDLLYGQSGNDKLYGQNGNDSLYGGNGNDSLSGGAGNDKLYGQDGNDSLVGGDGKDTLSGGVGNDKLYGNAGNDSLVGGDGKDTLSGGKGNDKLYGNAGDDSLLGGDGNDLLYGQAGDDKIYGQSGDDTLYGGSGNDSLWGGIGDDLLKGGKGNDWLKGGDGSDTFIYVNGDGKDTITGFDSGDLLQITGTFSASYNSSKKEIYFKVGSTAKAITLTDFGLTTTFHVNNDTYQLSGNQFKKR